MSGPALTQEQLESRRKARADQALLDEATRESRLAEQLAARREALEVAVTPLNKRILHSRRSHRLRRAKAKRAAASRRRNR